MDKEQQKEFIVKLCDNLKLTLLNKIDSMPESWEELEIRQYMSEKAQQFNPIKMTRTRMWNYKDVVKKNKM
ncbi:hypothetical protein [Clostridium estertheticum]|uniref:hypothetical protein n=1 Tax=Clostridium estertheticum TaxID=238834 RepID=UPI001C0C2853|nr:hypothetical protein [Clostridium estertheticum]MBU3186605.1 hypothetical protein [Clostridium estertheticum]